MGKKQQKPVASPLSSNGVGRPTRYKDEYVHIVRPMAALCWPERKIAEALNVSHVTLWTWKKQHPEFLNALSPTNEEVVEAVRGSLIHRALGYSIESEKIMTVSVGNGMSEVVREPFIEHYPPDVTAQKYILNNRDRKNWTERQEVETHGDVTVRIEGGLPDDEEMS